MKRLSFILIIIFFTIACSKDDAPEAGPITHAAADIYMVSSEDGVIYTQGSLIGNTSFQYQDGVTTMTVSLSNMEPNTSHAMHLHSGSLTTPGRHWNQNSLVKRFCNERSLGAVWAKLKAGDVGNIDIDENGNGTFIIRTDLWTLGTEDDTDISGTVLFIHHMSEDFITECDPNHDHSHGHTNAKIAGGTVVLGSQVLNL